MGTPDDLLQSTVLRLQSLPELKGIEIIPEDRLDILTAINTALYQAKGMVIVVSIGDEEFTQPANPTPTANAELFVEIGEIPSINRSETGARIPGSSVSRIVVKGLHHFAWEPGKCLVARKKLYDKNDKTKIVTRTVILSTLIAYS